MLGVHIPEADPLPRWTANSLRDHQALHLVVGLDRIEQSLELGGEDLCRLQNIRNAFPELVLTICSDMAFPEVQAVWSRTRLPEPEHVLTEGGLVLHHRHPEQGWGLDRLYREWMVVRGVVHAQNEASFAFGLEYLETSGSVPRPLLFVGHPDRDRACLGMADLPLVAMPDATDEEIPHGLVSRSFKSRKPGLADVIHLVLAYFVRDGADTRASGPRRHRGRMAPMARTGIRRTEDREHGPVVAEGSAPLDVRLPRHEPGIQQGRAMMDRMIVGIDFSKGSWVALQKAIHLTRVWGGRSKSSTCSSPR